MRAMTDDTLSDRLAEANLALIRERADRRWIKGVILGFYCRLLSHTGRS